MKTTLLAILCLFTTTIAGCWRTVGETCTPADRANCFGDEVCVDGICREPTSCGENEVATSSGCESLERLTAGESHFCALFSGGELWCWGGDALGQRPNGTHWSEETAGCVLGDVDSVDTGWGHTCVVRRGGVECWGWNSAGQANPQNPGGSAVPIPERIAVLDGDVGRSATVTAGHQHTCVVDRGRVACWGANDEGQVTGMRTAEPVTPMVAPVSDAAMISAGENASCALVNDGRIVCWGDVIADGVLATETLDLQQIETGVSVVCGWRDDQLRCAAWEPDAGSEGEFELLEPGVNARRVDSIVAGWTEQVMCGVFEGDLRCGTASRLGDVILDGVSHVAVGRQLTCAARDGQIECWKEDPGQRRRVEFLNDCGG